MIDTRPTLLVMAKAPRVGVGKQRLAAAIGATEAWRVNRALHAYTLRAVNDPRWRVRLCVAPDAAAALDLPGVWPRRDQMNRMRQGSGDLGRRLARLMAQFRNVAVIGADCPQITRRHVAQAFAALNRVPFVLGPSEDGGFYLLAARDGRAAAAAMACVRWSSVHAAEDVLHNLNASVAFLPPLFDIDTAADLQRWRASRHADRSAGVVVVERRINRRAA